MADKIEVDITPETVVKRFLSVHERRKTVNPNGSSSYGWKHIVEAWSERVYGTRVYISNDTFIAVCRQEGIRVQEIPGTPNALIALSSAKWNRPNGL